MSFSSFLSNIAIMIPLARSDPGPARLDRIWTRHHREMRSMGDPNIFSPSISSVHDIPQSQRQFFNIHINSETMGSPTIGAIGTPPKKRSLLMKILRAPLDFIERIIRKWKNPSEIWMKRIQVAYWIVLMICGIITTAIALAPFCI